MSADVGYDEQRKTLLAEETPSKQNEHQAVYTYRKKCQWVQDRKK